MRTGGLRQALEQLRLADGGLTDGQLLGRFLAARDEAAFSALVRRHGPMVLGVCRRLLGHEHDAEDAFQATFLLLARKAPSVVRREALVGWLHSVAWRTALKAKARACRRRGRERQVENMPQHGVAPAEPQDWRPLLDRELTALPDKYRAAVALCDLEGKPRREAARQLGLSEGTLSSRLARARCLLARRLTRRGVALSGGALATALDGGAATAAVPLQLVVNTAKVAALVAAGNAAAAGTPAALLMRELQRGMQMAKLKVCAALAAAAVLLGAGGFAYRAAAQTAGQDRPRPVKSAEVRPANDMDLLRKEVELLKLQVELLQEKVRAQGAELRDLKGQAARRAPRAGQTDRNNPFRPARGAVNEGAPVQEGAPLSRIPANSAAGATAPVSVEPRAGPLPTRAPGSPAATPPAGPQAGPDNRGTAPGGKTHPDAVSQVEAALKALRQARDPEARRRAADALERAVKRLRGRPAQPDAPDDPFRRP